MGLKKAEGGASVSAEIHGSYQPNHKDKPIPAVCSSACRKWQIKVLNSKLIWAQRSLSSQKNHVVLNLVLPNCKIKCCILKIKAAFSVFPVVYTWYLLSSALWQIHVSLVNNNKYCFSRLFCMCLMKSESSALAVRGSAGETVLNLKSWL